MVIDWCIKTSDIYWLGEKGDFNSLYNIPLLYKNFSLLWVGQSKSGSSFALCQCGHWPTVFKSLIYKVLGSTWNTEVFDFIYCLLHPVFPQAICKVINLIKLLGTEWLCKQKESADTLNSLHKCYVYSWKENIRFMYLINICWNHTMFYTLV